MKQVDEMNKEEREELLNQIEKYLKENLSEKRYLHSVSTMEKSKELSKTYNMNEQIVKLTALSHDIAKEMTKEECFTYAKDNNIKLDKIDNIEKVALHGKIGADIVKKKYGFNKEMQDAILYHSTARENMTLLDKIIFLADKTEKRRTEESADKLREIMEQKGLDEAILWDIDYYTIQGMIRKRRIIHPNTIYARNDIISKLKPEI